MKAEGNARVPILPNLLTAWFFGVMILWFFLPVSLIAEPLPGKKNIIYVELGTILLTATGSLNVERVVHERWTVRAGYGSSIAVAGLGADGRYGWLAMANYITRRHRHKFELGGGLCLLRRDSYGTPEVWPALAVGYRYQRPQGGFFFRSGLSWTYGFGFPFQASAGLSF